MTNNINPYTVLFLTLQSVQKGHFCPFSKDKNIQKNLEKFIYPL